MLSPRLRFRLAFLLGAIACAGLCLSFISHERARAQGGAGAISFSQPNYSANEGANASITLTRIGGTSNQIVAKLAITDVTTSPSDYSALVPGKIDAVRFAELWQLKAGESLQRALFECFSHEVVFMIPGFV